MSVSDKQLETTAAWPAGLDNLSPENDLTRDDKGKAVIAFRIGQNLDLWKGGKARRREGRTQVMAYSLGHSLWREGQWPFALAVIDGTLTGIYAEGQSFQILEGIRRDLRASYALVGERVFWSNSEQSGVVNIDGSSAPWGCPTPYGNPMLSESVGVGGLVSLENSRYQVAITWVLASGEESGALLAGFVEIQDGSGVLLSNIPAPEDPAVYLVRVYMTPADGDVFYHATDLSPTLPTAIIGKGRQGKLLDTQFLVRMPPGHIVRVLNGRLFVAVDDTMYWSEALRYGLTHPVNNRLRFSAGRLKLMEPIDAGGEGPGMYVSSGDRTYWLGGNDPGTFSQKIVDPYGAIPGTGISVPAKVFGLEEIQGNVAYWINDNGVAVLGLPGGQITKIRADQIAAPIARSGASMFRERNGIKQVVTSLSETAPRGLVVKDTGVITIDRYDGTDLPTPPLP